MKLKNVSRLILLFSIFFTTVLSGCVEEIDYSHYNQRQVVVNCILTSDSVQHLSLTYSNELHNTIYDEVEDATALLYEDGYLVGTFKKSAYAEWVLKYRPKFGRNYRLEVKVEGKETIYAETKFPKELRVYREYERDTINNRWMLMPEKYTACFKHNVEDWMVIVPPFSGLLNDIIGLEDTKNVQAIADEQDIYKMIYLSMETLGKTIDDWKVDPEILIEYFDRMCDDAIPDYTSAAIVPGKLDTISFDDNKTTDINKVSNATKNVLNNSGGAQLLNSQAIQGTTGLLAAIKLDTKMAISSLLPQVEGWLNRFTTYYLSNPCRVKFFEISHFTKSDLRKELLENATYSLPTKLAVNVLSGFSELETLALNHLEEDILGLGNIFTSPLQSSHTTSNVNGEDLKKDPEELTDSGEASREKRDRSNG